MNVEQHNTFEKQLTLVRSLCSQLTNLYTQRCYLTGELLSSDAELTALEDHVVDAIKQLKLLATSPREHQEHFTFDDLFSNPIRVSRSF